jgi:hypothetical protein
MRKQEDVERVSVERDLRPRDAQKGGQGAISKHHPERQLAQDAKPGSQAARPRADKRNEAFPSSGK